MDRCVRSLNRVLIAVIAVGFVASGAWAGVSDPVPLINGTERAKVLYLVPGVTANANLGTIISCTSTEKSKDQIVAIEVFEEDPPDVINDITLGNGVVGTVSPGENILIEIATDGTINGFNADENFSTTDDVVHGSARVLSTSKKLICTAAIVEVDGIPPDTMMQINMIVKKQKGD